VSDIAYVAPGIVAGRMPVTNIMSLPGQFTSGEQLAKVFMRMVDGPLKPEYDKLGIKIITASGTPPYQIFTRTKVVRLPADAKGLKLRGGGGDADDFMRESGINVINMPASQMYESLQKGVLDGVAYLQATAPANHLQEVTKQATEGAPPMLITADDENEQSRFVAQRIEELREEGVPLSEIAVLFRASSHSFDLEIELAKHGIPFRKFGGIKFAESAHIKDVLAFLRVVIPVAALVGRRANAPRSAVFEEVWALAHVVREARAQHRTTQLVHRRHAYLPIVERRAVPALSRKHLVAHRIVNNTDLKLPVTLQRDRNTETRIPMRVVRRTIEWIDDPLPLAALAAQESRLA